MSPLRIAFSILLFCSTASAQIRVAAAISLKPALDQIVKAYESQSGAKVELTFGSSGQMLAQIRNGAEIDLFISAANSQVDELLTAGLGIPETRKVIAGSALVLVVPTIAKDPPRSFQDLATVRFRRISIGEPKTVPAGQYAMQVLTKLGLADAVQEKLIFGANVRQVLTYVEQGEVVAGIVYSTDARESGDKVRVVATADASMHDPIVYPAIVIKSSKQQEAAKKFLDHLSSDAAKSVLNEKGFSAVNPPSTSPSR